jgi:hypothetical protein
MENNTNRAWNLQQLVALLKVGYTGLQYWLTVMTPESYHFAQARNYDQLGASRRSAHHSHEVLKYAEYPEPRARLGYYYANLGKHADAAEHYRKAVQNWPHPSIMLALAQAELRTGDSQAALDWLARVESSEMKEQLQHAIAELRSELARDGSAGTSSI